MEIVYRRFEKNDFLSLSTISDDEWKTAHLGTAKSMLCTAGNIEQCFVATIQNTLVGYIYGFALPNKTLIPEFLYVLPQYRKQGIGADLLKTLESNCNCSASMIFYHKSLHDYYAKLGYEEGSNLEIAMKDISPTKEPQK